MRALVMGGGMSGLAAAINLLDLGIDVSLAEADEIMGGRASSWLDADGDTIDNALHVFMPYYVNLLNFFEKMGVKENIIWKKSEFYYAQPGGHKAVLKFASLPAPLHVVYAMAYLLKDLRGVSRLKLMAAGLSMALGLSGDLGKLEELDKISMESFLGRYGSIDNMRPLMEPSINGLTFTPSYAVSAKVMLNWFVKMFASAENSRIGFANGGLGEIWVEKCLDRIREKGGEVRLKSAVTSINIEDRRIESVVVNDSETLEADLYVSAISPYSLRSVLPDWAFRLEYFRDLWRFVYAPSLSLQVWFDRKITDVDVTFFSNDCIFNTYADLSNVLPHVFKGGSMLEMVISPADHVEGLPDDVIFEIALRQIRELFPDARVASVEKWKVVRERQGVYRPYPGMDEYRPYQRTPIKNFYLAGDYTRTHVSSGGMEAAIWTANKVAELVAMDKLGRKISLNEEYKPYELLAALAGPMRLARNTAMGLLVLALLRKLRGSSRAG